MLELVSESVATLSSELMFEICYPNQRLLKLALGFDVDVLEGLTDLELSKFVLVLSQYLVYLKYRENEVNVRKIELSRVLETALSRELANRSWKSGITFKEKIMLVVSDVPSLKDISDSKSIAESEMAILDGMYNAFSEYINAYKKEQARRLNGRGFDGKTQ